MATIKDGKGVKALAVLEEGGRLMPTEIGRPQPGPKDVRIQIQYCGMCHSDIHATNGDWGMNLYPMAPGHEIAGVVLESNSPTFKVGDRVGVGCFVESCQSCSNCQTGWENYCDMGTTQTYSSTFPSGKDHDDCAGYHTNGGYSEEIVVHDRFVFKVPDQMESKYVGPLLCAGITTYSPLNRLVKGKKDQVVGIVGFGGLGMMATKLAVAMGAKVTIFSRSTAKADQASKLGATLVSHQDADALKGLTRTFDTIIDTVSSHHEIASIMGCLKVNGTYCFLGGVPQPYEISSFTLLFNQYNVTGSLVGGVPETQEMLDFCTEHSILPDIQVIAASEAADTYDLLAAGKAPAHRHVIDMSTLKELY